MLAYVGDGEVARARQGADSSSLLKCLKSPLDVLPHTHTWE